VSALWSLIVVLHIKPALFRCLYAFDNKLTQCGPVAHLKNLSMVYLQQNYITSLAPILPLGPSLVKLHVSFNALKRVEGLNLCTRLQELYVAHQGSGGGSLQFEGESIQAISKTLKVRISDILPTRFE
jgi:hypothetical protein